MIGLNYGTLPTIKNVKSPIKGKFFSDLKSVKIVDLKLIFTSKCKKKDEDDYVNLAKLYFLETFLLSKQKHLVLNTLQFCLLEDEESFEKYPWGTLSYERTIDSFKNARKNLGNNYGIGGFPYAAIIWAFEKIKSFKTKNLVTKIGDNIPRILNKKCHDNHQRTTLSLKIFDSSKVKCCATSLL